MFNLFISGIPSGYNYGAPTKRFLTECFLTERFLHNTFPASKRFLLQKIACHKTFLESGEKSKPSQSAGVISEKGR